MPRISVPAKNASPSADATHSTRQNLILCLLLRVVTLLVYNRAASAGFINFDDPQYITNNPHIQAGLTVDTVRWSFTAYEAGNWHPLTWLSHALDAQLFHLNPTGHHYSNVLFHAANAVLLFLVLLSATGQRWPGLAVSVCWALHPMNVESVVWVAERKNVLSMFFFLLALYSYGKYARRPQLSRYLWVALLFALGLMAKPQIITLPFVLLLWDYWPLLRFQPSGPGLPPGHSFFRLALEKLPLFVLATGSAMVTLYAQRLGHAVRTTSEFLSARVENALVSYYRYLKMAFWPSGLSPIYPHPEGSIPVWHALLAAALLLLVTGLVLWHSQRRYLAVGWFWFLGTMVPMIGLVQVGQQAMADRYAYLPMIGLFIMVAWSAAELPKTWPTNPAWLAVSGAIILIALATVTYHQIGYWQRSEILWTRALAVTERNYTAEGNLADALARLGRSDEAIVHFEAAERLHRYSPPEVLALGMYERQNGHIAGAIEQFKKALQSPDPGLRQAALNQLAAAYRQNKNREMARATYLQSLQNNPNDAVALVGMGLVAYPGEPAVAVANFSRAVAIQPSDVGWLLLSAALRLSGKSAEAQTAYERASEISPDLGQAQAIANQLLASPN